MGQLGHRGELHERQAAGATELADAPPDALGLLINRDIDGGNGILLK
jgi:hypothetical protein